MTYTPDFDSSQGDKPRDLPFLVGFGPEAASILALAGIEHDGSLAHQSLAGVLMNAVIGIREGRWTSYTRARDSYTFLDRYHPTLRRGLIITAVETAARLGLIEHTKGRNWRDGGKGWQSRFRASDRFTDMLSGHAILNRGLIIRPTLREVLQLRHPETGALLSYRDTAKTRAMRDELLAWNADLARHKIEIRDPRVRRLESGLLEVPTKDGADTFLIRERTDYVRQFSGSWDRHGRCYGPHVQSLPKPVRKTIAFDDAQSGRLDYGNSHIRIAYAEAGADPGLGDAYAVAGYETEAGRKLIKVATNVAINAKDKTAAVERVAYDLACADRRSETGSEIGARIGPEDMGKAARAIAAIERRHPALERVLYTGAGLRFMAIEADVVMGVVKAARRYEIPVLSIHDETVFPADSEARIEALMHQEWRKRITVPALVRQ